MAQILMISVERDEIEVFVGISLFNFNNMHTKRK